MGKGNPGQSAEKDDRNKNELKAATAAQEKTQDTGSDASAPPNACQPIICPTPNKSGSSLDPSAASQPGSSVASNYNVGSSSFRQTAWAIPSSQTSQTYLASMTTDEIHDTIGRHLVRGKRSGSVSQSSDTAISRSITGASWNSGFTGSGEPAQQRGLNRNASKASARSVYGRFRNGDTSFPDEGHHQSNAFYSRDSRVDEQRPLNASQSPSPGRGSPESIPVSPEPGSMGGRVGSASPLLDFEAAGNVDSAGSADGESTFSVAHELVGGAITRDVYKWHEDVDRRRHRRAKSFTGVSESHPDPVLANIKAPGGFRRAFMVAKAESDDEPRPNFIAQNFIDFIALFGHFAGGDYLEDEDDYGDDLERDVHGRLIDIQTNLVGTMSAEDLEKLKSMRSSKSSLNKLKSEQGTATVGKVVFLLLKSFIGTGVLLLPRSFYYGGLAFSTVLLLCIAALCLFSMLLLVRCREKYSGSFGDLGGILYGKYMRLAVLTSISLSQASTEKVA